MTEWTFSADTNYLVNLDTVEYQAIWLEQMPIAISGHSIGHGHYMCYLPIREND